MPTKGEVLDYLKSNPEFTKEHFLEHASPGLVEEWVMQRSKHLSAFPNVNRVTSKVMKSNTDLVLKPIDKSSTSRLSRYLFNDNANSKNHADQNNLSKQQRLKKKKKTLAELSELNEKDLLMELIRDIAHELDVNSLSHKILVNVGLLTNCDRSSLFLCKGHKDRKYLVSRLFDVTIDSTVEEAVRPVDEEIIIPFGVGIAGHAAHTGEIINIKDAYKDPRFNRKVDEETGYKTNNILCMPIKNQESEVIGVAQIINKREGGDFFSEKDVEVFQNYLTFCGIGLTNAQLFDASVQEYKRNQVLLNLARNIFEDTEYLDAVVQRIMTRAQDILNCQRCTVYIIDTAQTEESEDGVVFSSVFDLIHESDEAPVEVSKDYWQDLAEESTSQRMVYAGFAMLTANSGEVMNIDKFGNDPLNSLNKDDESFKAECMLCCPILNNHQDIIGVAQLLNKKGAHSFDENDEAMLEGFAIFCGLGIHNTQMYEKASLMLARQKLNMEVLQYHASAGPVEEQELVKLPIPSVDQLKLDTFEFDDIDMTDMETCQATLRMFIDVNVLQKFRIPHNRICNFILTVKKNYRPVIYHNWRHAFNVAQSMYTILKTGQMMSWFTDLEIFVLLVGCLCHDLDHRGTNNQFQVKSESPISRLYGTSTMEHHHFDHSVMILKSEGSNIFDSMKDIDYKLAMKILEDAILSTDLALYFKRRTAFQDTVESQQADWTQFENRNVLRGMMMTACDVAAITKPWEIQERAAELIANEFFQQGDMERSEFSMDPINKTKKEVDIRGVLRNNRQPMMDRSKHKQLPSMQVGFIDFVCMQLYKVFYQINPMLKPLYDGVLDNKKNWQNRIDKYEPKDEVAEPRKQRKASESRVSQTKNVTFSSNTESRTKSTTCSIL